MGAVHKERIAKAIRKKDHKEERTRKIRGQVRLGGKGWRTHQIHLIYLNNWQSTQRRGSQTEKKCTINCHQVWNLSYYLWFLFPPNLQHSSSFNKLYLHMYFFSNLSFILHVITLVRALYQFLLGIVQTASNVSPCFHSTCL